MKIRLVFACLVAITPTVALRRLLYRLLLGYRIERSAHVSAFTLLLADKVEVQGGHIGPFNVIRVGTLSMEAGSLIRKFNHITTVRRLHLDQGAMILNRNFIGGTHGTDLTNGREELLVGPYSQLSIGCFIDVSDRVALGENVVVAGAGTQFWTHGFDHQRVRLTGPIEIGDNVFIGSASVVVQGVRICSSVSVGAGSVVHRSIEAPGLYASASLERKRQFQP